GRGLTTVAHTSERAQELLALRLALDTRSLLACRFVCPSSGRDDARLAEFHPFCERRRARLLSPYRWTGSNEQKRGRANLTAVEHVGPSLCSCSDQRFRAPHSMRTKPWRMLVSLHPAAIVASADQSITELRCFRPRHGRQHNQAVPNALAAEIDRLRFAP